jgi:hypothetical protein
MTDYTPEQLLALVNSGKTLSELQSPSDVVSASLDDTTNSVPQTSDLGCSLSPVKDEVNGSSPVDKCENGGPQGRGPVPTVNSTTNLKDLTSYSISAPIVRVDGEGKAVKEKNEMSKEKTETPKVAALPSSKSVEFDGVDIANPVELLLILGEITLDPNDGSLPHLHDWQVRFMLDFSNPAHTKDNPFQACVQACNNSGKDKYIIAVCAVWLCMRYKEAYVPITSSSGTQLDRQTCTHLTRLCNKCNAIFGKLWLVQNRYFEFQHVGDLGQAAPSIITCFATDEAGKAEGYHPVEAGRKMALFTSETKSIPEDIINALERCTGFTHRVDASSPGGAVGYFYNTCSAALPRSDITDIKGLDSTQVILYKITAYDCSHISNSEIERQAAKLPGGKSSIVFLSSMMAEFGSTDEMVVIPSTFVWRAVEDLPKRKTPFNITWIEEDHNEAGLDLSDGGAEEVLAVRNGNKLIGLEHWKFEDSEDSNNYLEELFKKYSLTSKRALIRGDYCGLGGPRLRSLKRRGWSNIRFVDSRNKATEPETYGNRGTELFFNMRELFQNKDVIIFYNKLLIDQLCTRYYKIREGKIYQLLTKLEQKAKGFPSPDRADALNLCFWNYKTNKKFEDEELPFKEEEEKELVKRKNQKVVGDFDQRVWANSHLPKFAPDHVKEDDLDTLREELLAYNKQLRRN